MPGAGSLYREIVFHSAQAKMVHVSGTPLYANPACAQMYGIRSAEDVLSLASLEPLAGSELLARGPDGPVGPIWQRRMDGTRFRVEGMRRTVTWRKKPATLLSLNDVEARETARESRNRFMSALSHELRTPLNGVLSAAELLGGMNLTHEQAAMTGIIRNSGRHLLGLVEDLLEYASGEASLKADMQPFHLLAFLRDVSDEAAVAAEAKGLGYSAEFDARTNGRFVGDEALLRRALWHLLSNAVTHTRSGSVHMGVRGAGNGQCIEFLVSDTGPGIEPSRLVGLFEPTAGGDSAGSRIGGVRIGLAMARRIARRLGGDIEVRSTPGEGSEFRLTVPMERLAGGSDTPIELPDVPLAILVAEDNPANQRIIAILLERLGCIASVVANGQDALDLAGRVAFDAILMDLHMPHMDGYATTRAIRGMGGHGGTIPIVALTADARETARQKALEAGMDDFLTKPVTAARLASILSRLPQISNSTDQTVGDGSPDAPGTLQAA
jgi:two-component system, sensor histidine kinase